MSIWLLVFSLYLPANRPQFHVYWHIWTVLVFICYSLFLFFYHLFFYYHEPICRSSAHGTEFHHCHPNSFTVIQAALIHRHYILFFSTRNSNSNEPIRLQQQFLEPFIRTGKRQIKDCNFFFKVYCGNCVCLGIGMLMGES